MSGRALLCAVLFASCWYVSAALQPRNLLRETLKGCQPETLPEDQRCQYVLEHRADCAPRSGLLDYLAMYYCWGLQYWDAVGVMMVVFWIGVLFLLMFTASDRFFCPAMELLSEYLRLSPPVAGATLLALGNGAPDVFTQIAAASSGGSGPITPESLSMALSEPLGTGLFVGNVVLGLTVAMARGLTTHVDLKPSFFIKDVSFYLGAVSLVLFCLLWGKVYFWQCVLLMCGWVTYVLLTIYLSKDEDKVKLDPLHHEVPRLVPYGPWDDLDDAEVEDWDWLEALPDEYRDVMWQDANGHGHWHHTSSHHSLISIPAGGATTAAARRPFSLAVPARTHALTIPHTTGLSRTPASPSLPSTLATTAHHHASTDSVTQLHQQASDLNRSNHQDSQSLPEPSLLNGMGGSASLLAAVEEGSGGGAAQAALEQSGRGGGQQAQQTAHQHRHQPSWLLGLRERSAQVSHKRSQSRGQLKSQLDNQELWTPLLGGEDPTGSPRGSSHATHGKGPHASTLQPNLSGSWPPPHTNLCVDGSHHGSNGNRAWSGGQGGGMQTQGSANTKGNADSAPWDGQGLPASITFGHSAVGQVSSPVDTVQPHGAEFGGSPAEWAGLPLPLGVGGTSPEGASPTAYATPSWPVLRMPDPRDQRTATPLTGGSPAADGGTDTPTLLHTASGRRQSGTQPSQRQTTGAFALFKSTSSRYAYEVVAGMGGNSRQASGPPSTDVSHHPSTAAGAPRPELFRSGSFTDTQRLLDEHTVFPLLLQGKLQELSQHLDMTRAGAGTGGGSGSPAVPPRTGRSSVAGGSPVSPMQRLSLPDFADHPPSAASSVPGSAVHAVGTGSTSPLPETGGNSGRLLKNSMSAVRSGERSPFQSLASPSQVPSYTEQELAQEQKRLMKMLYWGHKQKRKEAAAGGDSSSQLGRVSGMSPDSYASAQTSREPSNHAAAVTTATNSTTTKTGADEPLFGDAVSEGLDAPCLFQGVRHAAGAAVSAPPRLQQVDEDPAVSITVPLLSDVNGSNNGNTNTNPGDGGVGGVGGVEVDRAVSPAPLLLEGLLTHPEALLKVGDAVDQELTQEVVADVNARVERLMASRQSLAWVLWRALRRLLVLFLSTTMPMIERRQELHYSKVSAVLFPVVGPTLAALYAGWWVPWPADSAAGTADDQPWSPEALRVGLTVCCSVALLVALLWPRDGLMRGPVLGVCTVLSFIGSMLWMNVAADELVGLLVAVGHVLELPAALLGATVLAWGNSLSDFVSNLTMARDGYPTMAITACFASPLFILLAGVAVTLSVGTFSGPLTTPHDLPTLTLYFTSTANMLMWAISIPFIFRFKLDRRITLLGCGYYALFQIGFVTMIIVQGIAD